METINTFIQIIPRQFKVLLIVALLMCVVYVLFRCVFKRWATGLEDVFMQRKAALNLMAGPVRVLFPCIGLLVVVYLVTLPDHLRVLSNKVLSIWFIIAMAWLIIRVIDIVKLVVMSQYRLDAKDNLEARRMSTQINVIERILSVIVLVIAIAAILMTFDRVRQVGLSIMASAGLAGIIIGFAAQRSIATLIAGIQIAITQPIRIDDVVIVENEWGWIEEITLTYVVVKIWDQRRLVVPITHFIEKPFQNWTRTTAEMLGTVYLYTDYGLPVDELRQELSRIVQGNPLWDGRVAMIQVTNTTDKTMELRVLLSAEDSPKAWDLRCLVREKLIDFMQRNYPDHLPRIRLIRE